ncbi:FAD-dependent oxidoreductase [Streptomyces fodineus]|uniref:FAD-dependent oxidoreductase n=1 Tax=Streptomyces fodineus TaxID=1904616 RepID=A0A1D7Y9R2_9ACTN|nr:NAD(P)/FAD-dependent oxidoreductase [Streptomyces fodineus]AOR32302.1 FAD-dependent oxidoreductase [Streptomyces fodineus]
MAERTGSRADGGPRIVVVGAGLVGPVAAMYLAARHGPVTVLERHPDPRTAPSRGGRSLTVILSARGWRALRELGLEERVRAIAVPLHGRRGHLPDGGTPLTPYSRDGSPIWAVERARLLDILLDAADATPGVEIRFGEQVVGVDLDTPEVRVRGAFGEHRLRCAHLLGCDGAHSAVRAAMVARGVREHVGTLELAYQEITLELPWCERENMHYWPAGDALFGAFPTLSPGQFTGCVFLRREGPAPSYAAAAAGLPLRDQFAAAFPELARAIPDLGEQLAAKPVSHIALVSCDTWVWEGRAALVGDSCHAMAPFMGQGMNCSFEDVRVLAACLDTERTWEAALAAYQRRRGRDADAVAAISLEHYRTMSRLPDPGAEQAATLSRRLSALFPDRFVPLYERCAFTEESYAEAQESERHLRRLVREIQDRHPGAADRIPDRELRGHVLSRSPL